MRDGAPLPDLWAPTSSPRFQPKRTGGIPCLSHLLNPLLGAASKQVATARLNSKFD
jgi:hypothetical protein